jgi:hypothetical protein
MSFLRRQQPALSSQPQPPAKRKKPAKGKAIAAWRQHVIARIEYLTTLLNREERREYQGREAERRSALIEGARFQLRTAGKAAESCKPHSAPRAWANLHGAEVTLLELIPPDEVESWLFAVHAVLPDAHLRLDDPRYVELQKRIEAHTEGERAISPRDREVAVIALIAAYTSLDNWYARIRSLRNILWSATTLSLLLVVSFCVLGALKPNALGLCFPPDFPYGAEDADVVPACPTGFRRSPSGGDVSVVAVAGLIGASLTAIPSLKKIKGTSTPYMLPLASEALKIPAGALSALLGILLVHGGFVPGLTALDTPGQILAWSAAFGASQHLVTRFIDQRTQDTLSHGMGKPESKKDHTADDRDDSIHAP